MQLSKLVKSVLAGAIAWIVQRRTTLLVWTVLLAALCITIAVNRSQQADTISRLSSPSSSVRDAEVLDLARSGRLASVLLSTEDPAGDASSAQNVQSALIRAEAGDSLVRVLPQLTPSDAFAALYSLQKDSVTSADAITGLTSLGKANDQNLKVLVAGLGDGDPDVRAASVTSLSKIGGDHVASLVAPQVKVDVAQDSALAALSALGTPSVPYVSALLQDGNSTEALKEQAAQVLGAIGDPTASPTLIAAATATPVVPELRRVCLTSLATIVLTTIQPQSSLAGTTAPAPKDPHLVAEAYAEAPLLIASLLNDNDDSFARSREAIALGRMSTAPAISALIKTLGSLDLRLALAAQAGIESAGTLAVPQLAQVLHDPNQSVRVAAASALGVIGTDDALKSVQQALTDPAIAVRTAAASGLGRSQNPNAVPILIAHLSDPNGSVASAVSHSLYELGAPAVGPLIDTLSSGGLRDSKNFYASQALVAEGDVAVPALCDASKSGSVQKRVWIADTLGSIRDPRVESALQALASDPDPTVKWAAGQALEQFEGA